MVDGIPSIQRILNPDPIIELAAKLAVNPRLGKEALRLFYTANVEPGNPDEFDNLFTLSLSKNGYSGADDDCKLIIYAGTILEMADYARRFAAKESKQPDPGFGDFEKVLNNYIPWHITAHQDAAHGRMVDYLIEEVKAKNTHRPEADITNTIEAVFDEKLARIQQEVDCEQMHFTRALYETLQDYEERTFGSVDGFEAEYLSRQDLTGNTGETTLHDHGDRQTA